VPMSCRGVRTDSRLERLPLRDSERNPNEDQHTEHIRKSSGRVRPSDRLGKWRWVRLQGGYWCSLHYKRSIAVHSNALSTHYKVAN
jgi:hypothetical protein